MLVTDIGRPPTSFEAVEWLDFLVSCPNRGAAIDEVIEDYPHVLSNILWWAAHERERLVRAKEQAESHLSRDGIAQPAKAFWTGIQHCADPFACLAPPNRNHDYTWRPGDPF